MDCLPSPPVSSALLPAAPPLRQTRPIVAHKAIVLHVSSLFFSPSTTTGTHSVCSTTSVLFPFFLPLAFLYETLTLERSLKHYYGLLGLTDTSPWRELKRSRTFSTVCSAPALATSLSSFDTTLVYLSNPRGEQQNSSESPTLPLPPQARVSGEQNPAPR